MIDADSLLNDELGCVYPYPSVQPDWAAVLADAQAASRARRWRGNLRSPRRLALIAVVVVVLCGAGTALGIGIAQRLGRPAAWHGMINDWLRDGRIDGTYSCGTTREAIRQLDHARFGGGKELPSVREVRLPLAALTSSRARPRSGDASMFVKRFGWRVPVVGRGCGRCSA